MREIGILGQKIETLEAWFRAHPGAFNALKRDELRTLYNLLGNEAMAMQQSDIILANRLNDERTNGKDPGQKPYRFLKAIRKSNFMSVSPPRSACLLAKVA